MHCKINTKITPTHREDLKRTKEKKITLLSKEQ